MSSVENDIEMSFITTHEIMNSEEIEKLIKDRKSLNENINSKKATREDFLDQIKVEIDLLHKCELMVEEWESDNVNIQTAKEVISVLSNRINEIYITLFNTFVVDKSMVSDYVKFASLNELLFTKCVVVLDDLMLSMHMDPDVYIVTAHCVYKDYNDLNTARKYISSGIKFHPNCKEMCLEDFWTEIKSIEKNEDIIDIALKKYNSLIKRFDEDMHFHFALVDNIIRNISVKALQSIVIRDMIKKYQHELMWEKLIDVQLQGYVYNHESELLTDCDDDLQNLCNCIETYEKGLSELSSPVNEQNLWNLFMDKFIELYDKYKDMNANTILDFMNNKIEDVFNEAFKNNKIHNAHHFIFWAKRTKGDKLTILENSVNVVKDNLKLWHKLMKYLLYNDYMQQGINVLLNATDHLKTDSMPLWENMELYMLNTDNTEEFYILSTEKVEYKSIKIEFRQRYLEWHVLKYGTLGSYKLFDKLTKQEPKTLKLYTNMIDYEKYFPYGADDKRTVKRIRKLYSDACSVFGKDNIDIWADCIEFEYSEKNFSVADAVYEASFHFLNPDLLSLLQIKKDELEEMYKPNTEDEIIEILDD